MGRKKKGCFLYLKKAKLFWSLGRDWDQQIAEREENRF